MEFIQTKAKVKNGQLILTKPCQNLPNDREVEVVIIVSDENQSIDLEEARRKMKADFKEAGIETQEQVLDLIREVKQELFQERFG